MITKFLTTKSLMKEINILSILTIFGAIAIIPLLISSISSTQFIFLVISIFAVHELAHLFFIKIYEIKWKPIISLLVIGYKNVAGRVTIGQWLIISLSGFLSTVPILFFYPQLFLFLILISMGDFYISAKILLENPVSMKFFPNGTLLYLKR